MPSWKSKPEKKQLLWKYGITISKIYMKAIRNRDGVLYCIVFIDSFSKTKIYVYKTCKI